MKIFYLVLIVEALGRREYVRKKIEDCSDSTGKDFSRLYLDVKNSTTPDKFYLSGFWEFQQEINGPLQLVMSVDRCDFKKRKCQKYDKLSVSGVCRKFKDKFPILDQILTSVKPKMECPIKKGNHTLKETLLDLKVFSGLPISNYLWIMKWKMMRQQKCVMCTIVEVEILESKH